MHQHLQPVRDGGRRPARPQRRRARPARRPARQDEPRARLARRHRLPRGRRACRSRSTRWASSSSATAARPASATRGRSPTRSRRPCATTSSPSAPCSRATATSRAASIPLVRASYLASPPLVVAYALAGSIDVDLEHEPLGTDSAGADVYLRELWPSSGEVRAPSRRASRPSCSSASTPRSGTATSAGRRCRPRRARSSPGTRPPRTCASRRSSRTLQPEPEPLADVVDARCLVLLGDSVTTDHISPAGAIPRDMPAGRYLTEHGVEPRDFNSFGARRGNHEVMVRGHVRQHPPAQRARRRPRGRLHGAPALRRSAHDLRRRRALRGRERAAGGARRQGVRLRARRATGRPRARCCSASAP